MNTRILMTSLLVTALAAGPVLAGPHKYGKQQRMTFEDRARVVNVEPIIEVVEIPEERQECWTEEVRYDRRSNPNAGLVVGGIIGGVVGNQVGNGRGKDVATVAGTIIGAAVGQDVARNSRSRPQTRYEDHCRIITEYHEEEQVAGYWVTMRYRGETFTRRMDEEPGKFVPVRVSLRPLLD